MTIFFDVTFSPDKIIWSHYLDIVSLGLQADVDVLKDMLVFRENKQRRILTHDEIESVIRAI